MRPHSNDAPGRRTNARRARGPDRRDPRSEAHTSELQSRLHLVSLDRKSTRLNSSHGYISYAVFCLKKKKKTEHDVTGQNIYYSHSTFLQLTNGPRCYGQLLTLMQCISLY